MKYLKIFENFIQNNELVEKAKLYDNIADFARSFPLEYPKSKVKQVLFYGTSKEFKGFDPYFERETTDYDFELPDGLIFLTTDIREAVQYGSYIVPVEVNVKKLLTVKVYNDKPSVEFDDDFNYSSKYKMYQRFIDGGYDALEIQGLHKSTLVTYPEFAKVKLSISEAWYSINQFSKKKL